MGRTSILSSKVEVEVDTDALEKENRRLRLLLEKILEELAKSNVHLQAMTDEEVGALDINIK